MNDEERMEALPDDMIEWLGDLPKSRQAVITARMTKVIEDTVGTWDDNTDPVLVEETFIEVATVMFVQDICDDLVEAGEAIVSGVDGDGNLLYEAV